MTRLLIAGAGIGGLTAALALARVGIATILVERAPQLSEVGAGLQLSPNACRVLRRLGLLETVAAVATRPAAIRVRAARSGRTLSLLPLANAEARWGAPYLVIHRAALQRVLLAAVADEPAIELRLGTALAGFGIAAGGGIVTSVRQGRLTRSLAADALVGADGIRSVVRARLVAGAADAPRETGRTAWRTLVPARTAEPLFARPETGLWLGRDAHLVHYPLEGGRSINVVAITRDATYPGGDTGAGDEGWAAVGDAELLARRFARWHPLVRALIGAAEGWTGWPLYDRAPLAAWNAGPVALLGDAAHPVLPFFAQGAAQAIEDADVLAQAMTTGATPADAFAHYSRARQARVGRVQDTARRLGRLYHLAGPAALARDAGMVALGPERLLAGYDWLYGE